MTGHQHNNAPAHRSAQNNKQQLIVGRITMPFGIQGWVKVQSYTDPAEGLFAYQPWFIEQTPDRVLTVKTFRQHGKGYVARLNEIHDRSAAESIKRCDILIDKSQLAKLPANQYYWAELIGLQVINTQGFVLGRITSLFETGANDVMTVQGDKAHLIPYCLDHIIKHVDLDNGTLIADWDANF